MRKDTVSIILNSARELFWKHGFRRVTVEEICARAGISKMTFYRYFTDKIELAKRIFENEAREGYKRFKDIISDESILPEEKINRILLLKFEGTNDIRQEFLRDFYIVKGSGLAEHAEAITNEIWQSVISDFREAQAKGIFRKDMNPEFFFLISRKFIEMFNDKKMVQLFPSPQEMLMEMAKLLLYGISPLKNSE